MTTHRIITREMLRQWDACYTDARIAALVPEDGLTPLQVLDLDIPAQDKLWVVLREDILPARWLRLLACDWAERACAITGWQDPRSLEAIAVARRHAHGMATAHELDGARSAAWAAAWAAQAAEVDAAWAAARDACAAARDACAAERAAWAAERAAWAAEDAAWAAARDACAAERAACAAEEAAQAASGAAWAAALDAGAAERAAWAAAETRQLTDIRAVLERLEEA